jgi:outer membrane protein OmpA-like peptidoglycan-associated protein
MYNRILFFVFIFLITNGTIALGQAPKKAAGTVIKLDNPSFEDFPRAGLPPNGWFNCGFASETPPDIQPGQFNVVKSAHQGGTYLGMVVRDNQTWEAVGQRLKSPLVKGQCYSFSIYLCRSELYLSASKLSNKAINYTTPVILRVWGGGGYCDKQEMLFETTPVSNTQWQEYKMKLSPNMNHQYIMLEAFYKVPTIVPYCGNLMVDDASDIVAIPCKNEIAAAKPPKVVAPVKPPVKPKPTPNKPEHDVVVVPVKPPVKPRVEPPPPPKPKPVVPEPVATTFADAEKIKTGTVLKIEKLQFVSDSAAIKKESIPALDEVYAFLANNPNVVVEIGGHTNDIPEDEYCNALSTARAKAVADYLVNRGILSNRVLYKGYGKTKPLSPDKTSYARRLNQRVEIKILSVTG